MECLWIATNGSFLLVPDRNSWTGKYLHVCFEATLQKIAMGYILCPLSPLQREDSKSVLSRLI